MIGLLGATGFTGRLTARWLAENSTVPVVLAGRDIHRLRAIADELGGDLHCIHADVTEPASLRALTAECSVVLSAAGPFARLGPPVVQACIAEDTHYVDITGEARFVHWSHTNLHQLAQAAGVRVVHSAGFDALPHDVGAWLTSRELDPDGDQRVRGYVWTGKGKLSGGTWRSALDTFSGGRLRTPLPDDPHPVRIEARLHRAFGGYAVPLPSVDPWIVLRSAQLLRYGRSFRYGHHIRMLHPGQVIGGAASIGALMVASRIGPVKHALERLVPEGSGPDDETRANGWMMGQYLGSCGEQRVLTSIHTRRDAGYTTTAAWLGTCGLALAEGRDLPDRAGVLTPVAALGEALLSRLPATGTTVVTRAV